MRNELLLAIIVMGWGSAASLRAQDISFNRDIRPIFSNRCFKCHGPDPKTVRAGLQLASREIATQPLDSGSIAVVAGRPEDSEMIARITEPDDDLRMPPADFGPRLSDEEVATLRAWIEQVRQIRGAMVVCATGPPTTARAGGCVSGMVQKPHRSIRIVQDARTWIPTFAANRPRSVCATSFYRPDRIAAQRG